MPKFLPAETDLRTLTEDIILLRMLNAEPARPISHAMPREQEPESSTVLCHSLPLQLEHDVVDSLAFLSAITEDPERVTAVCLEEVPGQNSCIIRVASNKGNLDAIVSGFERLAKILQSTVSKSSEESSQEMLLGVMAMNRNRILSRLRSKHATKSRKNTNRPAILIRLAAALRLISTIEISDEIHNPPPRIDRTMKALLKQFTELEKTSTSTVISGASDIMLVNILKLVDDLPPEADLEKTINILPNSGEFGPQGRASLVVAITKLRKYPSSCNFLVRVAKRWPIFRKILISKIKLEAPKSWLSPVSDASFLDAVRRNVATTSDAKVGDLELQRRVGTSLSHAQFEFGKQIATLAPKVHAEIQLLFFYECHPKSQPPRVICSSKSACFLCDLFIRLHGQFFVARTHGVLYAKWTLPDLDELQLGLEQRRSIHSVVRQFSLAIQNQIRLSMGSLRLKRTHPNESLAILPKLVSSRLSLADFVASESIDALFSQPLSRAALSNKNEFVPRSPNTNRALESPQTESNHLSLSSASPQIGASESHIAILAQHPLAQGGAGTRDSSAKDSSVISVPRSGCPNTIEESKDEMACIGDQCQYESMGEPFPSQNHLATINKDPIKFQLLQGGIAAALNDNQVCGVHIYKSRTDRPSRKRRRRHDRNNDHGKEDRPLRRPSPAHQFTKHDHQDPFRRHLTGAQTQRKRRSHPKSSQWQLRHRDKRLQQLRPPSGRSQTYKKSGGTLKLLETLYTLLFGSCFGVDH